MTESQLQTLIDNLGAALTAGDAAALAELWDTPGLVMADEGARAISGRDEVEAFFTQSIAAYREQGIVATRGELLAHQVLSKRTAWVDVAWPNLDADGREAGRERSFYLVRLGDDGVARVQAALSVAR